MTTNASIAIKIISKAESYPGIKAGIARLKDILDAPSCHAAPEGEWHSSLLHEGVVTEWPGEARSVLVLGLHHPEDNPRLDWWDGGNTPGNRRLIEISEALQQWLRAEHDLGAVPLPYHLEWGGLFLKDAAVLGGLGIIGRSNLLLHPEWGPRIRFRSILIEGDLQPTGSIEGFSPCETCDGFCHKACPQSAFPEGIYNRPRCILQLNTDVENKVPDGRNGENGNPMVLIKYCRACELACPVGK